ncbi:predicted protein [Naegleria gruberi]|uniref:Predicted protein n=1 Tax=Naegleria gruberi TaxID=5762 RepID=D2VUR6_NAEGR|nr:uncharacterized protein NAEGRDRAFT_72758 [Naegleria gruberi]EFC39553.1 predicted protein [Naegleria gruberi]|eukprot:XP_002672297.1 predicted protein [Naegleria gruberi strain NEG-M]
MADIDLMELSIEQLQQQFEQVQQESLSGGSYKLNEHNIIELIQYIKKQDPNFAEQLCFTSDGKEYITRDQIEYELQILLEKYGGRINKNELPKLLRVDFTYLEQPIHNLIQKQIVLPDLINGCEILTPSYLESVVMEINELLKLSGYIYIGTLTKQLFLPSDFIKEHIITKYMHLLLNGTIFSNNSLYTEKYINNLKSITIGICNSITSRSMECNDLLKVTKKFYLMNESNGNEYADDIEIELELYQNIVKDLIKNKQINGTLQVNSTLYVPNIYEKMATDQVCKFIHSNGYVSVERVESMLGYKAFKNTQQIINYLTGYGEMKEHDLINIEDEIIIHMKMIESFKNIFDTTINGNNDKHKSIPLHIENNGGDHCVLIDTSCEMKQLVDKYITLSKNIKDIIVFDNRYIMTVEMIDQILNDQFKSIAIQAIEIYLKSNPSTTSTPPPSQPSNDKNKKQKSKSTKSSTPVSNENDQIKKLLPKKDDIYSHIEKQLLVYLDNDKENENMINKFGGSDDSIIESIVNYFIPKLEKLYLETKEQIVNQQTMKLEQKLSSELNVEEKLNELYTQIVIHNKSIEILHRQRKESIEKEFIVPVEKHIIKTKCTMIVYLMVYDTCKNLLRSTPTQQSGKQSSSKKPVDTTSININEKNLHFIREYNTLLSMASEEQQTQFVELNREIKLLMKQLNQKVELDKTREEEVKELNTLVESLNANNTTLQSFISQFEFTAKQFSVFIKILDKKREKTYLKERKQELKINHVEHLAKLSDDSLSSGAIIYGTRLISICQYLLMMGDKPILLFIPGKLVSPVLSYLEEPSIMEEYSKGQLGSAYQDLIIPTLTKCQQLVVECLVAKKKKNDEESGMSLSKEKELVELFTTIEKIIFVSSNVASSSDQ